MPCIGDGCQYFQAVPDDPCILKQLLHLVLPIQGNLIIVKMVECLSEVVPFPQDGDPA